MDYIYPRTNVNFEAVKMTPKGLEKLSESFLPDKALLKKIIAVNDNNLSADVLVKDNEIFVVPNPILDLASMKILSWDNKMIYDRPKGYYVDYQKYDVYPEFKNGYYQIKKLANFRMPELRYIEPKIKTFGRLFAGATHIADDLDNVYRSKITEHMEKQDSINKFAKELRDLNIDIIA